MDSLYH